MGASATLICLFYIVGLLLAGLPVQIGSVPAGAIALLFLSPLLAFTLPRCWRAGPKSRVWLAAGVVGFLAALYLQSQIPVPAATDLSHLIAAQDSEPAAQTYTLQGRIATAPQLTRNQRLQFELEATHLQPFPPDQSTPQPVSGSVYVTVPLLQGTGLYPNQQIAVTGTLYLPQPATNPGGFDFQKYLAQQSIFTGMTGKTVSLIADAPPSLAWKVQHVIVRSQVQGAGVPEGPLISAMVMGHRAVDIPAELQNQFSQLGLSHALAASGFQVTLLLGVVLSLLRYAPVAARLGVGGGVLLAYMSLTGLEPSVVRAFWMGIAVLVATALERKLKPLPALLLVAVLMLLGQPLWAWNLGFQLSFLATLGLVVTVPPLTQRLDWLPPAIASLLAVPIAAYLWTLPLQLLVFGVVSPYSIPVNVVSGPLIGVISLGGMISALVSVMSPALGSGLAAWLYYPTHLLVQLMDWGSQLPGSSFAVGTIGLPQTIVLYGLMILLWWQSRWQRYWWLALILGLAVVVVPISYVQRSLVRATVLNTADVPVLVLQQQGRIGLINAGSEADVRFTVLPFLQKQGINRIDWAVDAAAQSHAESWSRLFASLSAQSLYAAIDRSSTSAKPGEPAEQLPEPPIANSLLLPQQPTQLAAATLTLQNRTPPILKIQFGQQVWLWLDDRPIDPQTLRSLLPHLAPVQVLLSAGRSLPVELLQATQPQVAILANPAADAAATWLKQHQVKVYYPEQDGAVQWTPQQGFTAALPPQKDRSAL